MVDRARSMGMDVVRREAVSDTRRSVVIAANDRARTAPEIDLAGLRFDNYRRNPVVMWAHDATGRSPSGGLPIGRTLSINRSEDGGIIAEFEFLEDDPFAQRIRNAWDKGFLQAASISWLPVETRPAEGGVIRDVRAELLEWSIVSVPADPDALRETHRRMLDSVINIDGQDEGDFCPRPHPNPPPEGEGTLSTRKGHYPHPHPLPEGEGTQRYGQDKKGRIAMTTTDIEGIKKDLADINSFVRERFEPVSNEVGLLREETERIGKAVNTAMERERNLRRNALSSYAQDAGLPTVPSGAYAGMDILDLALVRRFAHSQRREGLATPWIERAEEAKHLLVGSITPAEIQASSSGCGEAAGTLVQRGLEGHGAVPGVQPATAGER